MAFGTKYYASFKDRLGSTNTIYFEYDGYAGGTTELQIGPIPLMINYLCNDKYDPIIGCSIDIQLQYSDAAESMFVEEDRQVRVNIDGSNWTDWYFYLNTNQYFKQLSDNSHIITLTATDQLGMLKDILFQDSSNDPYFYLTNDLTALGNIINETGLWGVTMRDGLNVYDDNMDSDPEDSPLDQVYFYPEMYWNNVSDERGDCYTVLSDIVKKYGARLSFWPSTGWYFQRVNDMWKKHTTRLWASAAPPWVYVSNAYAYRIYNVDTEDAEWQAHAEVTKKARVGRSEVTADPGRKVNIVKNSTFETFTQSGGVPRYWVVVGADEDVNDGFWRIHDKDATGDPTQYVYTDLHFKDADTANIIITFKAVYSGGTNCKLHFALSNQLGTIWWNSATQAFQNTEVHYEFDVDSEIGATMTEYAVLTIPITNFDYFVGADLELRLRIYEVEDNNDTTAYVDISDVRFELSYFDSTVGTQLNSKSSGSVSNNLYSTDLKMCSAWNSVILDDDMHDTLRGSTGTITGAQLWSVKGDPTAASTIQWLLTRQYLEGNFTPIDTIRGTLFLGNDNYDYSYALQDDSLKDSKGYSKVFVPLRQSFNVARMSWEGEWEEITPYYTDEELDWASETFTGTATITDNSIEIDDTSCAGPEGATSDPYTAIVSEMIRIVVTCTDSGGGAEPGYDFDGNTGNLEWGINYLEFHVETAGAKTFQITYGYSQIPYCVVSFKFYSMI